METYARALTAYCCSRDDTALAGALTALKGNLDLAERALDQGAVAKARPRLGRSREALSRLAGMIEDLHRSARGESLELETEPVDLTEVIAQAIEAARGVADDKHVSLNHDGTPDAPRIVEGDADALLSVVGNLLSNALRYTPTGGSVTVRHWVDGDRVVTEIADTGIGMTPEVRAR